MMSTRQGLRPNVKIVRGRRPLTVHEAIWAAYDLARPRSVNTRKNYKVVVRDMESITRFKFRLKYMHNFKQKHMRGVFNYWKGQGLSDHSIANKMSIARKLLNICGKKSCILRNKEYGIRRYESKYREKRWTINGAGDLARIKAVDRSSYKYASNFKNALYAERLFGLRKREALLLKPGEQIVFKKGEPYKLVVSHGSKNGRLREILVTNKHQSEFLKELYQNYKNGLMPANMKYPEIQRSYYYFLEKNGLCNGHGLRQAYANERYQVLRKVYEHLGDENSIRRAAYSVLTQELGHNRFSVLKNYLEDFVPVK